MKNLLSACLLALGFVSFGASAQSDFNVTWEISEVADNLVVSVELDLDIGTRFISAHGLLSFGNGLEPTPITGTCIITNDEGVLCNLLAVPIRIVLDLGGDLNGTIRVVDSLTDTFVSGVASVGEII